ncbi:tandem-95 repeat protein, partial [Candidatus Bipolaricaulota bacterium]|nr:tandem-95 repeat protein [Candidatus Bipolaricaulota bacterium]
MRKAVFILGILLVFGVIVSNVAAQDETFELDYSTGIWIEADDTPEGLGTSEIRWGEPEGPEKSGYEFIGSDGETFEAGEEFLIGEFWHYNWPVSGDTITWAKLKITLHFSDPPISPDPVFTYIFEHDETSNNRPFCFLCEYRPCERPCPDRVSFPDAYAEESYRIGDKLYTLVILGFKDSYPGGTTVDEFITQEQENNRAYLVGMMTSVLVPEPQIRVVEKYVSPDGDTWYEADEPPGPEIVAGTTVYWKYVIQNTGNVTLTDITVYDDQLGEVGTLDSLDPGEAATFYAEDTAQLGQYVNVATVEGYYEGARYADDEGDLSYYKGVAPDCANYTVTYLGKTESDENTTFSYEVSVDDDPALSHWVLELSACITEDQVVDAGPGTWEFGKDPTTGLWGIKFETEIEPGESVEFYFTLEGKWHEGSTQAAIKAGPSVCYKDTEGPVCNNPPVAVDDEASTETNTPVDIDVLDNDYDPDGDDLTIVSTTDPEHGSVTNNGTDVTYTPDEDWCGTDTFEYTITDGYGGTDTATVTVDVACAPCIELEKEGPEEACVGDTITYTYTVRNCGNIVLHGGAHVYDPLINPDGDHEIWSGILQPGDEVEFTKTYTIKPDDPDPLENHAWAIGHPPGYDSVRDDATWSVDLNHPPAPQDDEAMVESGGYVDIDVLANDTDPDDDELTITSLGDPSHGTVSLNTDGTVRYTPEEGFTGEDSFTYEVSDGVCSSASATVYVTVVDGYVEITPSEATNEVGEEHTFTITAHALGAAPDSWDLSYELSSEPDYKSLSGPEISDDGMTATWELTIRNDTPGTFEVSATVTMGFGELEITRATDGNGQNSDPAQKTYIQVRLELEPEEASNQVGKAHTFTATLEYTTDGTTWSPLSGETVAFSWSG